MDLHDLYKRINVKVGKNCQISDFCSLENVVIGDNVIIREETQLKNVIIGNNSKIGRRVTIYTASNPEPAEVGSDCAIGYNVFCEATAGKLIIGNGCSISQGTMMFTSIGPGENNAGLRDLFPEQRKPITIGNYCWIGAGAVILAGARLEEGVVIGANSVVWGFTYKGWASYNGNPAVRTSKHHFPTLEERSRQ